MRRILLTLAFLVPPLAHAADIDYVRDVKPILKRCASCHGAVRQKAGLRLDAASLVLKGGKGGPVIVPGKPDESTLIDAVLGKDRGRMPPEKDGEALSAKEIGILRDWIRQGARAPDEPIPDDPRNHWAYRPPVRPPVPQANLHPVDAFLSRERDALKIEPNPAADRSTLLRRVFLDLIGVPPSRDELLAFLNDTAPDAYEKAVDRLLASPRYGERWGRHWMDVWRYSDPFGLGEEYRYSHRHVWRWRDWIIESLNQDKGYDRMIVEMLAADEIAPTDRDTLRATGYLARNWYKFNRNVWIQDTVEYTAAGFLGVTLRCARCHDHKYDPISQQDYYRFRAFFEPHDVRIDPIPGQPDVLKDGVARAFDAKPDAPTYLFQRGDERSPLKEQPFGPGVPNVLGGETTVQPVEFTAKDYARALEPAFEEARVLIQRDLMAAGSNDRKRDLAVAALASLQARAAADRARYADSAPKDTGNKLATVAAQAQRRLAVLQAADAVVQAEESLEKARAMKASDATKKAIAAAEQKVTTAKKVHTDAIAAATKTETTYTSLVRIEPSKSTGRRLALARWITDVKNPLTARVAVNHMWMRHFGKPLVASVANFGLAGKKPSHPELLDWLAVEFMESGWRMKPLHRLLVTSEAYRLSSRGVHPVNQAKDPDNRTYWRTNPRRMEAEAVRDSVLAVADQLDPTMGGPILDEKLGQTSRRRSVYFRINTEYKMQFLDQFDLASPTECYERHESVLPQQALALNNSVLALNQARLLARRLSASHADVEPFLRTAFEQVLGRAPTTQEQARCESFLREQTNLFRNPAKLTTFPPGPEATPPSADPAIRAREDLIQVLFNHNDFVTIR